jgi:hypothetical protein
MIESGEQLSGGFAGPVGTDVFVLRESKADVEYHSPTTSALDFLSTRMLSLIQN